MSKTLYFSHAIFLKFKKQNRDGRARKKKYRLTFEHSRSEDQIIHSFEHVEIQTKMISRKRCLLAYGGC